MSLTGASQEGTVTVFGVVRAAFLTGRFPEGVPQKQPGGHSAVRTAELEPTQAWIAVTRQ